MKVTIAYEIVTEESAEFGDAQERGWEDEHGVEFDSIEDLIEYLENNGPMEASSLYYDSNAWYRGPVIQDRAFFEQGEHRTLSYFLKDISEEDKETVFNAIVLGQKPGFKI